MNLKKLLDQFDAVSGAALFILLVNVIGLFWYNATHGKQTESAVVTYALGVLAAKTTHGVMTSKLEDKDPGNDQKQ